MDYYFNPATEKHFPDMMIGWPQYHNDNQKENKQMPDKKKNKTWEDAIQAAVEHHQDIIKDMVNIIKQQSEIIEIHASKIRTLEEFQAVENVTN